VIAITPTGGTNTHGSIVRTVEDLGERLRTRVAIDDGAMAAAYLHAARESSIRGCS